FFVLGLQVLPARSERGRRSADIRGVVQATDDPGGNTDRQRSRGYVANDHGAGADHRAVADRHAADDRRVGTDPHPAADHYRRELRFEPLVRIVVAGRRDDRPGSELGLVTERHAAMTIDLHEAVQGDAIADLHAAI